MTIQTFVFFDVETTGIPANAAKVTEISLISVSRTDIEQADGVNLPAMSKLSLLCNPKKNIQPTAIKLTGLTNQFLQNQPDFKDHIKCINAFLDKPKPVCLVAHNGKLYDFKILQAEYQTANEKLPHDLLCVDSLSAFRTILKNPKNAMHDNSACSLDESDRVIKTEDWQDLSTEEIQEIDELVDQFSQLTSKQKGIKVENESKIGTPKQFSQLTSTPIKVENETKIGTSKQCTQPTSTPKGIKVENESKSETPKQEKAPRVSYALSSVYKKLLNKKPKECHRAEADCIMLLECVIATKHDFLVYADSKQKFISQI